MSHLVMDIVTEYGRILQNIKKVMKIRSFLSFVSRR